MKFRCKEDIRKALAHAESMGDHSLRQCFDNLRRVELYQKCDTEIYTDHAPLSFYFVRKKGEVITCNGGVIFHGPHDGFGSGSAPTFSVTMNKTIGWSIHT